MRATHLIIASIVICMPAAAAVDPFAQLRAAYADRDSRAAANAYERQAEVIYRYDGSPEERHVGREAIAASFKAFFEQVDSAQSLDLNFRVIERGGTRVAGVYRLRIGRTAASYGRFTVTLAPDGRFADDVSTDATLDEFEEAAGPVMLAADDETLDRRYYARLTGRYRLPNGCALVVTRSQVRLFVRNACTDEWRGLARRSGREWTAGDQVLSEKMLTTYRFAPFGSVDSPSVEVSDGRTTVTATRQSVYSEEDVTFVSADGTKLTGTLYVPTGALKRRRASVMLHGSGPQDRDGHASIIAVMADQLAASGRVVLAYDKRGSGGSDGDGDRASFDTLADDANAAMAFLATRPEVEASGIGLAGSSQAGWVAARTIARGAAPADVLLLGAAGAAMTVGEQNLYNTEVRMGCAGIDAAGVRLALDQQRAFFAHLRDPTVAAALDALTKKAVRRPDLADWLFPDSRGTDRSAGAWYIVLDPDFDPMPVWRAYRGRTLFLFGEHDDATPTRVAMHRLAGSGARAKVLPGAQHLGLLAVDRCKADLPDVQAFSPHMMRAIAAFGALASGARQ